MLPRQGRNRMAQPNTRSHGPSHGEAITVTCGDCGLYRLCFAPRLRITGAGSRGLQRLCLARGEALPANGAPAVFAVRAGALERQLVNPQGEVAVTGYRLPGELVALGEPAPARRWLALQPSHLCALPRRQLDSLLRRDRQLPLTLTQLLVRESETGIDALQRARQGSAVRRMATLLLDLSRRMRAGRRLLLPMSRRSLAAYLDMTLATASRTLSGLETRGVLRRAGRLIELHDPRALQALAAGEAPARPPVDRP